MTSHLLQIKTRHIPDPQALMKGLAGFHLQKNPG